MDLKSLIDRCDKRESHKQVDSADTYLYGTGLKTTMRVASDRPSRVKAWTKGMSVGHGKVTSSAKPLPIQVTKPPKPLEAKYSTDEPSRFNRWVVYALGTQLSGTHLREFAYRKFSGPEVEAFVEHVEACRNAAVPEPAPLLPSNRPSMAPCNCGQQSCNRCRAQGTVRVENPFAEPPKPKYPINPADIPYWTDNFGS